MSDHIDLNAAADPQTLAPPKRGRGRPRKNPPPNSHAHVHAHDAHAHAHAHAPTPTPPPPAPRPPDPTAHAGSGPGPFAPGDMVWGKKLTHPAWPGQVISAAGTGAQFLVSFFGDKAFSWCDAAQLRPYEPYFPVGELYDGEADDFDAAVDASLDEFSRRVEAALTAAPGSPIPNSASRPFVPRDLINSLQDLAADRMGFSNRVQAAIAKAHLRAFDKFRGLPDPPEFTLELGLPNAANALAPAPATPIDRGRKGLFNCNSSTPSRRGRKRKEEVEDDSDEDWDPRKKGASDSDSDVDMERKRGSRGRGRGASRGRPRGRPRKTDAGRAAQVRDEEMEEIVEYPSPAQMLLQLTSAAANPFNFKGYDSVPLIVSFFSKYKDSEVPNAYNDKELLETLSAKKGRKKSVGSSNPATKAEHDNDKEQSEAGGGQRGRRKSAGSLYSTRKAEDSYWCDIIISDFDDGDTSSDYEGSKRKRVSQTRSGNRKMKQEVAPQDGASTDTPEAKLADGPTALILHFSNAEAIPSVDDINSIFRIHGPIVEGETEITKKSKIAKVVFSKRSDAERAYSSSGQYNAFGPALLRYEVKYLPSAPLVP